MSEINGNINYCNPGDSKSYWILASSAITLIVAILIIITCRIFRHLWSYVTSATSSKDDVSSTSDKYPILNSSISTSSSIIEDDYKSALNSKDCGRTYQNSKDWAKWLLSGQTISGKVIMVFIFLLSIGSMILYIYDTNWVSKNKVAKCEKWFKSTEQKTDIIFNLIFMVHFFLRFISSNDKLMFLIEIHSIVDLLTIPPSLSSIFLSRNWIGLRFIRAIRLVSLPSILQTLNIIRTSTTIRLLQLITFFSTMVVTTAGFIHMVENSGDPPNYDNAQNISYFDAIYYMVVTFSTVGFGDITCKTYTGKSFMIIFILGGLAVFANSFPEIADIIQLSNRYNGAYNKRKSHIILCGHITYETVSNFLADFLHKDREGFNVEIVILDNHNLSQELEILLKKYTIHVKFFKGSVMKCKDMARIHLKEAECCLVLTNKYTDNADSEDAANILRVISIKNYCSQIKVIIQLIQYHNKAYLLNIPSWKMQHGDDVICLAELKLGFIAASSFAPGFSTLMLNLFTMRSFKMNRNIPRWQNEYLQGSAMELYSEYFSNAFLGLTFEDAALLSYNKLNLVLIAIQIDQTIIIYPSRPNFLINVLGTQGYFIAQSQNEVTRALYFCLKCHGESMPVTAIRACCCDIAREARVKIMSYQYRKKSAVGPILSERKILTDYFEHHLKNQRSSSLPPPIITATPETTLPIKLSSTDAIRVFKHGLNLYCMIKENDYNYGKTKAFHWTHDVQIEDATLTSDSIENNIEICNGHIILCIFAEVMSPLIGLRNFIFPLRSSHISYEKLKPIILLGNLAYLEREWKSLMNFPKLYVYVGSPLNRIVLRALRIERCSLCVILSSKYSMNVNEHSLVDKEAILSSLNIKAMRFDDDNSKSGDKNRIKYGDEIPLITELAIDSNVQFLDHDDQDDPKREIFMTQSFACGSVFTVSVLDSLMSTAYFNEDALGLIRVLLSGCITLKFEQLSTEGTGLECHTTNVHSYDRPYHIKLISLNQSPLSRLPPKCQNAYGELFNNALTFLGIICIGIYRRLDIYDSDVRSELPTPRPCKRYVVTNPSSSMRLFDSDLIYCLSADFTKLSCDS